jgi:hypothetical protein
VNRQLSQHHRLDPATAVHPYWTFRRWVNGAAGDRLRLAAIPDQTVQLRMLGRARAVELACRPGGLPATELRSSTHQHREPGAPAEQKRNAYGRISRRWSVFSGHDH